MVRHEAVRRNDGPMMTLFWKMDMMNFGESNHTKYFILAHRLIAGINNYVLEVMLTISHIQHICSTRI